jgi:mono/diheme cytochrome c family protein
MWSKPTLPFLLGLTLAFLAVPRTARAQQSVGSSPTDTAVVNEEMTGQGRKIFHGKGNCYACHGQKLQGGPIAPPLLGPKWRNGDGSFDMFLHVVRGGVPGTMMVSRPGGISDAEAILVATYVYAVSRSLTKP